MTKTDLSPPPGGDARREWDTDELLEGDAKVAAVRHMFDAIAPRYDRLNRIISFRLDVRWRKRAVRDLALPSGSRVLDLASGTGDLCIDLARGGIRPISIDLSFGMLAADRSGAPRVQADILRLPVPDVVGRWRHVRVRAAQSGRPADVLRRTRAGGAARWPDRPARREHATESGHPHREQHLLRPRRATDRRGPLRRRGLPVPAEERRLPAVARRDGRDAGHGRASRPSATPS